MSPASVGHSAVECPDVANHQNHIDFYLNKVGSGLKPSILLFVWICLHMFGPVNTVILVDLIMILLALYPELQ